MTSGRVGAVLLLVIGAAAASLLGPWQTAPSAERPLSPSQSHRPPFIAANGRVEPASEEISLSAAMPGLIRELRVAEGDRIRRGQVLAVIENDVFRARVLALDAEVARRTAELQRLLNGARPQERREAAAEVAQAKAMRDVAQSELRRRQSLQAKGFVSQEQMRRAEREVEVAQARLAVASERAALINAPPREEDVRSARASLDAAKASLAEAKAMFDNSLVKSPIDGAVLRVVRRAGEALSETAEAPILIIGDVSRLRVRAEVDERDIGQVAPGQEAYVTAEAFGARRFAGRVSRIGLRMGRKTLESGDPAERRDTRTLDVMIDLEQGAPLVSGQRVDVFIPRARPAAAGTP